MLTGHGQLISRVLQALELLLPIERVDGRDGVRGGREAAEEIRQLTAPEESKKLQQPRFPESVTVGTSSPQREGLHSSLPCPLTASLFMAPFLP